VDTGATKSIIPPHVVRQLDLIIARQTMAYWQMAAASLLL
jgi:hypothetical protein